jgi:16S rRNA processing protein RimM
MPRPEWIEVGRISRPHGVHGEVRVSLSSDNPERFLPGVKLHARPGRPGVAGPRLREPVGLTIESVRGEEDFPIVAFREIADRDRAEAYGGYILEIQSSQLPELDEDEFYPFDLIGLEARDPSGSTLGKVVDALESPAHAILVVSLATGGEALVPFVKAAVMVVDVAAGHLVIDPELISMAGGPAGQRLPDVEGAEGGRRPSEAAGTDAGRKE